MAASQSESRGLGMSEEKPGKTDGSEVSLGHLATDISFVTRLLRAQLMEETSGFFEKHGVASGQVALINLIALNPGVSQKELAEAVVLKKSALTKAINELERSGLIERRKGGGDQRYNALHLSAAGEARVAAMKTDMLALQDKILGVLDPTERVQLFDMIWRVIRSL